MPGYPMVGNLVVFRSHRGRGGGHFVLPFLKVRTFCCARLPYRPRILAVADSSARENNIVQGSLMVGNLVVPGSPER